MHLYGHSRLICAFAVMLLMACVAPTERFRSSEATAEMRTTGCRFMLCSLGFAGVKAAFCLPLLIWALCTQISVFLLSSCVHFIARTLVWAERTLKFKLQTLTLFPLVSFCVSSRFNAASGMPPCTSITRGLVAARALFQSTVWTFSTMPSRSITRALHYLVPLSLLHPSRKTDQCFYSRFIVFLVTYRIQ